jgi:hypothetical protein
MMAAVPRQLASSSRRLLSIIWSRVLPGFTGVPDVSSAIRTRSSDWHSFRVARDRSLRCGPKRPFVAVHYGRRRWATRAGRPFQPEVLWPPTLTAPRSLMRRTHASLGHHAKVDPKVSADQGGHGIGFFSMHRMHLLHTGERISSRALERSLGFPDAGDLKRAEARRKMNLAPPRIRSGGLVGLGAGCSIGRRCGRTARC